ncbi:hypothetical protein BH23CHL2_BH23CHL2_33760 [soil metagenome]
MRSVGGVAHSMDLRELLRIVDGKINELTVITESDDTENNRIQIENALYPRTPLVGFYLPVSNGGQLETTRDVVEESITGSAAGLVHPVCAGRG